MSRLRPSFFGRGQSSQAAKAAPASRRRSVHAANFGVETLEDRRMLSVSYLHSFLGTDGANPSGGLVRDTSGNIFGIATTVVSNTDGEIFEMVAGAGGTYTYRTLYTFTFTNASSAGYGPKGRLVLDSSGNLFGTTDSGGANSEGNIFEITRASMGGTPTATTLYSFGTGGDINGTFPEYGLAINPTTGTLYGTTSGGGNHLSVGGDGAVFKFVPNGTGGGAYTVLHLFDTDHSHTTDNGADPSSTVTLDSSGNLFFTTYWSTTHTAYGELYEMSSSGTTNPLFDFGDTSVGGANPGWQHGRDPLGNLTLSPSGTIYGTTEEAGPGFNGATGAKNYGVVYTASTGGLGTVIGFPAATGSGNWGPDGGLAFDTSGNAYGTTVNGGSPGVGDIYEVSGGAITELDAFSASGPNTPRGTDLVVDGSGNIFGTTTVGSQSPVNTGDGTVYEETPSLSPHVAAQAPRIDADVLTATATHAASSAPVTFSSQPVSNQVDGSDYTVDALGGKKRSHAHV